MIEEKEKLNVDPRLERIVQLNQVFNNFILSLQRGHYYFMESLVETLEHLKNNGSEADQNEFRSKVQEAEMFSQRLKQLMADNLLDTPDIIEYKQKLDNLDLNPDQATDQELDQLEEVQDKIRRIYHSLTDPDGYNYPDNYLGVVGEVK